MTEEPAPRRGLRIDLSDLVLEIISIGVALGLATAVGQAIDAHRTATRTTEVLTELWREIARDDAALAASHPLHVRVHDAFASTVAGAREETLSYDAFAGAFARTESLPKHASPPSTRYARLRLPAPPDLKRRFGARRSHARVSVSRTTASVACANVTTVAPRLPQPPGTGAKTSGCAPTTAACCSGVSGTIPDDSSCVRVAKIFVVTRKSG
jgi:hypothetical protein